ncbi:MAG: discoidin domain-containing protein [Candidatus Hydrogenedentes bacterium]|nr:discoidin domain-containing protein [Candidatus Hydrogenedentota bacterium]
MALQSAEMLASAASLETGCEYPSKAFYDAWLQMLLNMDRNTLWGSAAGMVFETSDSWDVKDRLTWVEESSRGAAGEALNAVAGEGAGLGVFDPVTWKRMAPLALKLPDGKVLSGIACEAVDANRVLCNPSLQPCGVTALPLADGAAVLPESVPLPDVIETQFYTARIDAKTGALTNLKLKGGAELLRGPANVVFAEKVNRQAGDPGDFIAVRSDRKSVGTSSDGPSRITVTRGPISTTVTTESEFYGGKVCRRVMRFYETSPRIDCEVDLEDIPDKTVVVVEFPLAGRLTKAIRGIPYGFSEADLENPAEVAPWLPDIVPAIQWSDSMTLAGGLAILDKGLTGRELHDSTPILYLMNATDYYRAYPNTWLSGVGKHHFEYALVPHSGNAADSGLPRLAWEFNMLPVVGLAKEDTRTKSFVETSDRLIVEAMRREGSDLELRLADWTGKPEGKATVTVNLPHQAAAFTDMNGQNAQPLTGGPAYEITVRPQQIVTLRLKTAGAVPAIEPRTKWDDLVPEQKRAALNRFVNRKGHPPHGDTAPLPDDAESAVNLGKPAKASNVYHNDPAWSPGMATDANPNTRWATDDDVRECWIEVDLGAPVEIRRAFLSEGWDRVQAYELQYDKDGAWTTFYKGGRIGKGSTVTFPPVTVQRVRLHVLEATGGPTIWEFLLFKEGK